MPDLKCPKGHKITDEQFRTMLGAYSQSKRKTRGGGRPRICERCGVKIWPHDKLVEGGNMHEDCTMAGTFD